MTTTPHPTPEAVEAAIVYIKKPSDPKLYLVAVTSKDERPSWSDHDGLTVSARILAAEVERLREQADAVCEWTYDEYYRDADGGIVGQNEEPWMTQCSQEYPENYGPFCPNCGRKVKIQPQTNEEL